MISFRFKKQTSENVADTTFKYLDESNLYGWVLSQKLFVGDFIWVENRPKFNEDFIKSYNEDSNIGYFFEVEVQYPEKLHELHNDLPFLPEGMQIRKVEKLVVYLRDKKEHAHIRNLKQALDHGLILKKVQKVIRFNQEV